MSFDIPTPNEIQKRLEAECALATGTQHASLPGTPENMLARQMNIVSSGLHSYLKYLSQQILPATSEDGFLEEHAGFWLDEGRKAASQSIGSVTVVGTIGITVPAGTVVTRPDGNTLTLNEDAIIPAAGFISADITSTAFGVAENIQSGIVLTPSAPIIGLTSITVDVDGITGGADEESDFFLIDRIIDKVQNPAHGGNLADYITWAKEVPGVTRAWSQESNDGVVTVNVTFVMDNKIGTIIPSVDEVNTVEAYIAGERPVGARPNIFAPETEAIDFSIALNPNTVAVQNAVQAELEDFFAREATPNGVTLYVSRISEAISVASDEFQHVLTAPAANIVVAFGTLPVLGEITWSAA